MADIQNTLEACLIQDFLVIMLSRLLICLHVILFLVQNIVLVVFLKWDIFKHSCLWQITAWQILTSIQYTMATPANMKSRIYSDSISRSGCTGYISWGNWYLLKTTQAFLMVPWGTSQAQLSRCALIPFAYSEQWHIIDQQRALTRYYYNPMEGIFKQRLVRTAWLRWSNV